MNVQHMGNTGTALATRKPRRQRGVAPRGGKAPLTAPERELHDQLKKDRAFMSGRAGAYVYYVSKGKQRWRRYVVPKDARTDAQRRSREAFCVASKAWSQNGLLTEEERAAWHSDGVKRQSRRRMGSSGRLTGQQDFIGRNCEKRQRDHGLVTEPSGRKSKAQKIAIPKPQLIAKGREPQPFTLASSGIRRAYRGVEPGLRGGRPGCVRRRRRRSLRFSAVFS